MNYNNYITAFFDFAKSISDYCTEVGKGHIFPYAVSALNNLMNTYYSVTMLISYQESAYDVSNRETIYYLNTYLDDFQTVEEFTSFLESKKSEITATIAEKLKAN